MAHKTYHSKKHQYTYPLEWDSWNRSWNSHGLEINAPSYESLCFISDGVHALVFQTLEDAEEKLGSLKNLTKNQFEKYCSLMSRIEKRHRKTAETMVKLG